VSYVVLARKWRPQTFHEIIGQQAISQTLANSIRIGRIGHAFLFSGPRGIGKTSCARILSKALNCENGPTAEPCNTCHACTEITEGNSLDVLEIDGASNRGIDEIRELRESIRYSPAALRFKIIIIDEVHMLTREAFNALLKTLEEPPGHAKFILATTEAHKVPVTIVSRCQRYDFRRIDIEDMKGALTEICQKEKISIQPETVEVLALIADGSLRDGLSLLDQVISFSGDTVDHQETMRLLGRVDPALVMDIFKYLAAGDGGAALERFGRYVESGGDEAVFNRELMETTRDLMALSLKGTSRYPVPAELVEMFSIDQLERFFKVLLDLEVNLRNSDYPRLVMDVALVKMSRIRSLTPLEDIIARLDESPSASGINPATHPPSPIPSKKPAAGEPGKRNPVHTAPSQTKRPETENHNGLLVKIIRKIPEKDGQVSALLEHGSIIKNTEKDLVIGFKPEKSFYQERLKLANGENVIQKAASEVLDRPVNVSLVSGDAATPPSLVEETTTRKKKETDERMKLALDNPVVSDVIQSFNARVRDIRLRTDHSEADKENEP
jgi:DNA polymerase III subunit gamma/tau